MAPSPRFTLRITDEGDGMLSAEVEQLPGCFASGRDMDELFEAATEAIQMYLAETSPPSEGAEVVDIGTKRQPARAHVRSAELELEAL